jgi:Nucleotidyl transferase AbiEii toxin, Type IV TA system
MVHKETVAKETLDLIRRLMNDEKLKDFNLVGGTALSLQIGRLISEDIDLFSKRPFDSKALIIVGELFIINK